jgi:transketolase
VQGELPAGWQSAIPTFTPENGNVATRASSGIVLNAIAAKVPDVVGGSADLSTSNLTTIKDASRFTPENYGGRNFAFGIREHGMAAIMNGMSLHGGLIPFGGTFLIFSDYMRPSVRLAALMRRQVIYVYTHDSIGLGEDGPTHQPIGQLSALRAIPNLTVIRPGDANEVAEAWRAAISNKNGPTALALTRQKVPLIDRTGRGAASELARGGYVLQECDCGKPQLVIMASGSEVSIALDAQRVLEKEHDICTRVVSMPCHEFFLAQSAVYRRQILPAGVPRIAIEAAHPMSWQRFVGDDGIVIGLDHYGASAPYQRIYQEFGLTADHVVRAGLELTGRGA